MDWLTIPICVVEAYLTMIPALRGQSLLEGAHSTALGTGSLDKADSRRLVREWSRPGRRLEGPRKATTPEERIANAAAVGITIERS